MGVIDWFKRGVGEMMVARPDDAKPHVVWKHPDTTIPLKSQLTVEADERAVFFRDGKVVKTMQPGRHTLDTMNLPFLSEMVDSFTGGNVFIAEVFFVNVREHTGVKFGGRVGHVERCDLHRQRIEVIGGVRTAGSGYDVPTIGGVLSGELQPQAPVCTGDQYGAAHRALRPAA